MPRFYFHLRDDMDVPDEEGKELPNAAAARACALDFARFELSEMVKREGRITLHHRIDIEDEGRRLVHTISFRDVVELEIWGSSIAFRPFSTLPLVCFDIPGY